MTLPRSEPQKSHAFRPRATPRSALSAQLLVRQTRPSPRKRVKGTFGEVEVTTPRDRGGTFEPQLVKKRQTRLGDFEDKILALYARGMSTRDIERARGEHGPEHADH